jgi:heme exporter protein CcmD
MSDHTFFIWGSYGVFAVALFIEIVLLRARAKRTLQDLKDAQLVSKHETKT